MRSFVKGLAVLAVSSLVGIAVLEVAAARLYAHYMQRPFDKEEIAARLLHAPSAAPDAPSANVSPDDPRVADQRVVIHPYFGYTANPAKPGVNAYGFFGADPLAERSDGVARVAITGGSVADQLVKTASATLAEALSGAPRFAGRSIELVDLALGGYKQPQQLLVLATLLALGAQFDAVIDVDGFNEIDGAKDNLQDGINPYYPYTWNLHARQALDPVALVHMSAVEAARARRETLRTDFARWPVPHSAFLLTLWDLLDRRQEATIRAETAALRDALAHSPATPQQTGPAVAFADDNAMYADFVEVWARASLEMAMLCASHGIAYFQFLQPNQYFPESKTLTAEERQHAYDPDVADTGRVATAYPMLRERGRDLVTQGVPFTDLTMLFKDEPRSVYGDTCCHLNSLGNAELAEAIGRVVGAAPPNAER
jgi:hypothetical protein